jgi:hypothetical protein
MKDIKRVVGGTLLMDCYLDVVGGLVPLRCEGATPKAVRMGGTGSGGGFWMAEQSL